MVLGLVGDRERGLAGQLGLIEEVVVDEARDAVGEGGVDVAVVPGLVEGRDGQDHRRHGQCPGLEDDGVIRRDERADGR